MRFKAIQKQLSLMFDGMKRDGTFKKERIITSAQSNMINTSNEIKYQRLILLFSISVQITIWDYVITLKSGMKP